MAISIVCTDRPIQPWIDALKASDPAIDVYLWPNETDLEAVELVLCWKHPQGVLQRYPNLRCICSMGAGVDHLLNDPQFPKHIPVARLIDPLLTESMFDYVSAVAMYYFCRLDVFNRQQESLIWRQFANQSKKDTTVGIMGLGQIGGYAAREFSAMGFNTIGWSRSKKSIDAVETFAGSSQLDQFLSKTHILICLLPLTEKTMGILNAELFNRLPEGACVINVARGQHLVEKDLLEALDTNQLRGACLDVFEVEPLPEDHPFWRHEKILLTPHCSSITDPRSVAPQIVQNYRAIQAGGEILNQVDLLRGY